MVPQGGVNLNFLLWYVGVCNCTKSCLLEFENNFHLVYYIFGWFSLTFHIWLSTFFKVNPNALIVVHVIIISMESNVSFVHYLWDIVQGIIRTCGRHFCHKNVITHCTNKECSWTFAWKFKCMISLWMQLSRLKVVNCMLHGTCRNHLIFNVWDPFFLRNPCMLLLFKCIIINLLQYTPMIICGLYHESHTINLYNYNL